MDGWIKQQTATDGGGVRVKFSPNLQPMRDVMCEFDFDHIFDDATTFFPFLSVF